VDIGAANEGNQRAGLLRPRYESGTLDTKNGFYEISAGVQRYRALILAGPASQRVLEYRRGMGGHARVFVEKPAVHEGRRRSTRFRGRRAVSFMSLKGQ
jgi:hypothetical protein